MKKTPYECVANKLCCGVLSQVRPRNVVFSTAAGSLSTDKAGDEVRASINHAKEAGSALLERANDLGKKQLDQIDEIVNGTGTAR